VPLNVGAPSITGANGGDFGVAGSTCTQPVPVGQQCTIKITFSPGQQGRRTAILTIPSDARSSPDAVSILGDAKVVPAGPVARIGPGNGTGSSAKPGGRTKPQPPTTSHPFLSGIAKGRIKLGFTITAGRKAPALRTVAIGLPQGVSFSHRAKNLTAGITVKDSGGRRLKFTATISHGALAVALKTGGRSIGITIVSPAIAASKSLASDVKRHKVHELVVAIKATDVARKTTRLSLRWRRSFS
jgi:hypothetical protein